jgi:glycosyltransferase involved in cell wall biosynthesis
VQFLVVGDGPLRGFLEPMVEERGLQGHVVFTGIREDVPAILRHTDVFVLASLTEGLPITLLEALASEVPVVATCVGGIPEVVDDGVTGIVIPPADPGALRQAITWTLDHPQEAAERSRRGREKIHQEFSIGEMVRSYEEVYAGLLARKGLL